MHMAKIENGIVVKVSVWCACDFGGCDAYLRPDDDHSRCGRLDFPQIEGNAQRWLTENNFHGQWLATSYSGRFRGRYAGIGDRYDADLDEFVPSPLPEGPPQ